jgi:IS6 family transposase
MMEERGVEVDHSNIYRWLQKFTPQFEAAFRGFWNNGTENRVKLSSWKCKPKPQKIP